MQSRAQWAFKERYNLPMLAAFLDKIITESPTHNGIDLTNTLRNRQWTLIRAEKPVKFRNGDWVFWDKTPSEKDLVIAYTLPDGRSLDILVKRESAKNFKLVSITIGDHASAKDECLPEIDTTKK